MKVIDNKSKEIPPKALLVMRYDSVQQRLNISSLSIDLAPFFEQTIMARVCFQRILGRVWCICFISW